MNTREKGKWGEDIALEYLTKKGYIVLAKGFYSRFGEIDIIMKTNEFLVFVEVKTRKDKTFAHAREFVSKTKQRKIVSTAKYWLMKNPTNLQPRFDVIEVYAKNGVKTENPEIIHIENAFGT
ncbi:MAG: YraN family protein [Oscillospiraceae bacterium]|jgi:putative endonuclease|nr:YraN family protein [Oscillospiraceae bacterium]